MSINISYSLSFSLLRRAEMQIRGFGVSQPPTTSAVGFRQYLNRQKSVPNLLWTSIAAFEVYDFVQKRQLYFSFEIGINYS